MIRDHFSLNAWHDYSADARGEFHVVRLRIDWLQGLHGYGEPWLSIDAGLFGLNASLTYWPKGKRA